MKWFSATLVAVTVGSSGGLGLAGASQATPGVTPVAVAPSVAAPRIDIMQFKFSQPILTVPVGTTVTWTNEDEDAHTVTADDGRFTSAGLDHGEAFSYRFTTPGTYAYHCALHPHMTARIVVK
jgi:plastocyanin